MLAATGTHREPASPRHPRRRSSVCVSTIELCFKSLKLVHHTSASAVRTESRVLAALTRRTGSGRCDRLPYHRRCLPSPPILSPVGPCGLCEEACSSSKLLRFPFVPPIVQPSAIRRAVSFLTEQQYGGLPVSLSFTTRTEQHIPSDSTPYFGASLSEPTATPIDTTLADSRHT